MTELLLLTRCLNFLTNSTAEKPINREKTVTKKTLELYNTITYGIV